MTQAKHIFIAEDDPMILDLLRIRMELAGYSTAYARDGIAVVPGILKRKPDAIILDIGLPMRNGLDVLQDIRSLSGFKDVPVIMLTARNQSADVQKAISLGAQDYIAKPFDDQQLLARVARVIAKKEAAAPRPQNSWAV